MDSSIHGGVRRRNNREPETESQKVKREKAAERQRRKRERDRRNAALQQQQQVQATAVASGQLQQPAVTPVAGQGQQSPLQTSPQPPQPEQFTQELSTEEMARREKVRVAARDRQRKHRALVKQRRLRELGLDVGNDIMPGMEDAHYRAPDGQYHQVLPPELQQLAAQSPPPPIPHEPPFPQGAPLGGQTFASTLLLSFSCAPLLKQHLLRTLGMTNEELASLEPLIAEAWDRWDHQRRLHYAEVAKNGGQPPPLPPPYTVDLGQHESHGAPPTAPFASGSGTADRAQAAQAAAAANDFRARFHRSIAAPTPFQTANSTPVSTGTTSAPTEGTIDPQLATSTGTNGNPNAQSTNVTTNGAKQTTTK